MELETDKAVVELPCPHAGKVTKIHVSPGETVPIGTVLFTIEAATGAETAEPTQQAAPVGAPASTVPTATESIFLAPEGRPWPWHTANLMRVFDRVLNHAGIAKLNAQGEKLDVHALRTTCASRLARLGVPLVMAQRLLGHSSAELTARAYTSLGVEDLRDAIETAFDERNVRDRRTAHE